MFIKQIKLIKTIFIFILFISFNSNKGLTDSKKIVNLELVHEFLSKKDFPKAINDLKILSNQNNIIAQHLYSQILFSGNILPQDFEMAYYWSNISKLGGLKKSNKIINLLDEILDEKQKREIYESLKSFLKKHAMKKNKLAIIQIAKWHLNLAEEKDYTKAYKWFNIAVALGIKSAIKKRDEIINELSAEQILEAQKLSKEIFKKINQSGG